MAPAVVVALVVFQLIRVHVCDRYLVPSSSMEPTLYGDPEDGDLVLVDKTAFARRDPRLWDVVVARNPLELDADHVVKRLVARGPGFVSLHAGDVYVGRERHDLHLEVKYPPGAYRDMRVTWLSFEGAFERPADVRLLRRDPEQWNIDQGGIALRATIPDLPAVLSSAAQGPGDGRLPGHLSTAQQVDASFLNSRGVRLAQRRGSPRDIGITLTLTPEPECSAVQLVLEYLQTYYSLDVAADGTGRFRIMGEEVGDRIAAPPLIPGKPVELTFGYLDGAFFAESGTRQLFYRPVAVAPARTPVLFNGRTREPAQNLVHVGVAGAGARVGRLRIFHDIWYEPDPDKIFHLQVDELFLLGDNTYDSSDSRSLEGDAFREDDLVGVPFVVIGPPGRTRWLRH